MDRYETPAVGASSFNAGRRCSGTAVDDEIWKCNASPFQEGAEVKSPSEKSSATWAESRSGNKAGNRMNFFMFYSVYPVF
jgi:hypothetical protein